MKRSLPWILCALIALIAAPAFALGGAADPVQTANVVVSDAGFRDAGGTDPEDRTVDILVGGRVNFSYPAGTGEYNVVWDRGSLVPDTCEQTAGPNWGHGTTLPWWTQGPGWAGYCTFSKPGTYTYHSGVNPNGLKGTVVVHDPNAETPTATPTATAAPKTAKVTSHDTATPAKNWFQDASGSDVNDNSVTIQAGGKVTFDYPTGANVHNVEFRTASKPETCIKTKQSPSLPLPDSDQVAPMPDFAQPPGWEGECTFNTPGTYAFVCGSHPAEMTGTVTVVEATEEPTPTATPTQTETPTETPTPTPTTEPTRPGIVAHDTAEPFKNWFQDAASTDITDGSVTVAPGGTVDFSFPVGAGTNVHNVVFAQAPTSCLQKTGLAVLPAPPLPQFAMPPGWSGECKFDTPGTYTFVCSTHPVEMTGSVVVRNPEEPTPTPTATPTATPEPPRDYVPAKVAKPWAAIDKPKTAQMTIAKFLANKLTIQARCVSAGTGTLSLHLGNQVAAKRIRTRIKTTLLATANATCNSNGRFTVRLKPTKRAREALADETRSIRATVTLTLAGPIGTTTTTRTITLKGKGRR